MEVVEEDQMMLLVSAIHVSFMSLRLYTTMLPCHLTQVCSSATWILDGKNGGSGGGAGTNSSAALGGQSELLGGGLGSSGGTSSSAGA